MDKPYYIKSLPIMIIGKPTTFKLFLCSKDIQHGDEYFTHSSNRFTKFTDSYREILPDDYKVVAQISPDAIWVKNGDTFTQDEVELWWTLDTQPDEKYPEIKRYRKIEPYRVDELDKFDWSGYEVTAYLKCPTCKHAH